ncbi:enoyl-CoA hydratase/isomerase family protein [Streptomyces hirsutus]|uniref:enoyl-CoA hydratase/isomerase family protein n=1 Tax=Streptomyces hirsutus TaxID=35620 RepID=UPI0036868B17
MTYEDHVALAKRLYAALAAGDRAALGEILHPQFTGRTTDGLPLGLGGSYAGPEVMQREFWWRIGRHFRARAVAESFHGLDDGRLHVAGRYRGEGIASGRELDAAFVHLLAFSDDHRVLALEQLTDSAAWKDALEGPAVPAAPAPTAAPDTLRTIDYTVRDGVAVVCLDRPERRNAIDMRMAEETLAVARRIAADRTVRAVLIRGNGPALTVGGDIDAFARAAPGTLGATFETMTTPFHEALRILSRIDAPIVTAAHGAVAGGGLGFVYAADIVLAAPDTKFVVAFSALGLTGDGGGTWHLPRLVGPRRAARMYLENQQIEAAEAADWGLVTEVVPADRLQERALELATRLAAGPTRAFGGMRRLLQDSWTTDLSGQLLAEIRTLAAAGGTEDAAHAIADFAAGRRPEFQGR